MKTRTDRNPGEPGGTAFEDCARAHFDDSVQRIDAATLSKLNQGRQAALAEVSARTPMHAWRRWAPAAGIAAAAVLAVVVLQVPSNTNLPRAPDALADDFEILLGNDDLDMIEELEFFSWIELADTNMPENVG